MPVLHRSRGPVIDRIIGWRTDHFEGVSSLGMVLATLGYISANTPSLLPRPWHLQGVIAAVCALVGYVVGATIADVLGAVARWAEFSVSVKPAARRLLGWIVVLVVLLGSVAFPSFSLRWQRYTAQEVGAQAPGWPWLVGATATAAAVFLVVIGVWRFFAGVTDRLTQTLGKRRILRESIARVVASVLVIAGLLVLVERVILPGGLQLAQVQADRVNATRPSGLTAPDSPLRSGGPGSLEPWSSLGADGAIFVSLGPQRADIERATGAAAKDPIRVFVGAADRTAEQNRDRVLAELDRTRAWERRAIYLVTATSTGFTNEWSTSAFEYLMGGDCAAVSMQYSTLPSAFATLVASDEPPRASRILLDGVRARLATFPPERRPRLYVGGESLGSYGGNDAFTSPQEQLRLVDGAVWTGTPSFSAVRNSLVAQRDRGSTVVNPVIRAGREVRFVDTPDQLRADQFGRPLGNWATPRVVYLQHESDPVVWWSPDLLFEAPAWLRETRIDGPMAQMTWYPVVTFWQVTADMSVSNTIGVGYGHRYGAAETVPAWAAVLDLPADTDTSRVIAAITAAVG